MSAGDHTVEYMLREGERISDRMCHDLMAAAMAQSEMHENNRQNRIRDQRFRRFFRGDGRTPEWSYFPEGRMGPVEWVGIDTMPRSRIARIIAALERTPPEFEAVAECKGEMFRGIARERMFGQIMTLPDMIKPCEVGDEFPDCVLWIDAAVLAFKREMERREAQGRHW